MKSKFRRIALSSATALILIGFVGTSLAQTPAPDAASSGDQGNNYGSGMMNGYGPGMMGKNGSGDGSGMLNSYGPGYGRSGNGKAAIADRHEALKQELKITSDQAPAWKTYTDAVTASDQTFWTATRSAFDQGAKMQVTPDDRFAIMSRMVMLKKQNFDDQKAAAEALLTKLTPYQRGQASIILPGLAQDERFRHGCGNFMGAGGYGMGQDMMNFGK